MSRECFHDGILGIRIQDVTVNVQRELDVLVTHEFLHNLNVHSRTNQVRPEAVTEAVRMRPARKALRNCLGRDASERVLGATKAVPVDAALVEPVYFPL